MTVTSFTDQYRATVSQFLDASAALRALNFEFTALGYANTDPASALGTENADIAFGDIVAAVTGLIATDADPNIQKLWAALYKIRR